MLQALTENASERCGGLLDIGSRGLSHDPDQVREEIDAGQFLEPVHRDPVTLRELRLRSEVVVDIRTGRIGAALLAEQGLVVFGRHGDGQAVGTCRLRAAFHHAAGHHVELVRGIRPRTDLRLQLGPKAAVEGLVLRGHVGHVEDRVVNRAGAQTVCGRDLVALGIVAAVAAGRRLFRIVNERIGRIGVLAGDVRLRPFAIERIGHPKGHLVGGAPVEGPIPSTGDDLVPIIVRHIVRIVVLVCAGDHGGLQPVIHRIAALRWVFAPGVPSGFASFSYCCFNKDIKGLIFNIVVNRSIASPILFIINANIPGLGRIEQISI